MKKILLFFVFLWACKEPAVQNSEPTSAKAEPRAEKMIEKSIVVYAKGGLRLRESPSTSGKIILLMPHLSNIVVEMKEKHQYGYQEDEEYWLKAKYSGKSDMFQVSTLSELLSAQFQLT